ncbi:MAG: DUF5710 domain-containing protein [Acidimicrobiia bacterium]
MTSSPLRVPRADAATVKRLGARWDPTQRQWYLPADRDPTPFGPWLAPPIPEDGPCIPADIVLLPTRCYRCGSPTAAVAGLLLDAAHVHGDECTMLPDGDGWFLAYDAWSADAIATACPDALLARSSAGPLRWRTTRVCPDGYLANTCHHCGTVLGNWPLHETLTEYQAEGGQLRDLPHVHTDMPGAALQWLADRELAESTP